MKFNRPKKVLIIGASGKQGSEYLRLMKDLKSEVEIVGLVDQQYLISSSYSQESVPYFKTVEEAIKRIQFDVALLAVPHDHHYRLTKQLLGAGKHIIKEKPFAFSIDEAEDIIELMHKHNRHVLVTVQRRYYESFITGQDLIKNIGRPYFFKYEYFKNFSKPTLGVCRRTPYYKSVLTVISV